MKSVFFRLFRRRKRRVVYIAGCDFSSSTAIGSVLGSIKRASEVFHVGEYHAVYSQKRLNEAALFSHAVCSQEQLNESVLLSSAPKHSLLFWEKFLKKSKLSPYKRMFSFTRANVLVDSSKSRKWLLNRLKEAEGTSIEMNKIIICWNSPLKLAFSCYKRNFSTEKALLKIRSMMKELRKTLKLCEDNCLDYFVIRGVDFISDPVNVTKKLCDFSGIPYFDGKELYWNFKHNHLSGSSRQRVKASGKMLSGYSLPGPIDPLFDFSPFEPLNLQFQDILTRLEAKNLTATKFKSVD